MSRWHQRHLWTIYIWCYQTTCAERSESRQRFNFFLGLSSSHKYFSDFSCEQPCNTVNAFEDRLSESEHHYPRLYESLCENGTATKDWVLGEKPGGRVMQPLCWPLLRLQPFRPSIGHPLILYQEWCSLVGLWLPPPCFTSTVHGLCFKKPQIHDLISWWRKETIFSP